jgi:hypothetical protein
MEFLHIFHFEGAAGYSFHSRRLVTPRLAQESLAMSFEGMNLSEDALQCYDELESSFAHVLREKNLSWFGTLIIPDNRDDTLPLLSITKKPYRDLILANSVSVFDLRIYMLAKQCNLLGKMGKVADICNKVAKFLASFGRQLHEVTVSRLFTDLFVHTMCTLR